MLRSALAILPPTTSYEVWKRRGFGRRVPGYAVSSASETVVLSMDLAIPKAEVRGVQPAPARREGAIIDPGLARLERLRALQVPTVERPFYAAAVGTPVPTRRLPGTTYQYCLQLPKCLWDAPLFDLAVEVLWHPGVVGCVYDVPVLDLVPGKWQCVLWPAALALPQLLQADAVRCRHPDNTPEVACVEALDNAREPDLWPPIHTALAGFGITPERIFMGTVGWYTALAFDDLCEVAVDAGIPVDQWTAAHAFELRFVLFALDAIRGTALGRDVREQRRRFVLSSCLKAWAAAAAADRDQRRVAERRRQLGQAAAEVERARRSRSKRMSKPRSRTIQAKVEDESARFRRLNEEAACSLRRQAQADRVVVAAQQPRRWWMRLVWRVWVDVHWVERLVRGGCWDVAQRQLQLYAEDRQLLASDGSDVFTSLSAADGTTVSIVVESCQLGVNPGDVHQCTALFEGLAEAGTLFSIQSVPCYTPTFSCGGSYLRWEVTCAPPPDVAVGNCSAEPEPQPEEFVSLPRVEMVGVARLLEVGERWSEARGFPLTTVVKLDGVGLTRDVWQSTRRQCERTSADRDFGAQLDAWTSGLGCWEACGLDDDDDMDEPDAWRDSEALDYWDA